MWPWVCRISYCCSVCLSSSVVWVILCVRSTVMDDCMFEVHLDDFLCLRSTWMVVYVCGPLDDCMYEVHVDGCMSEFHMDDCMSEVHMDDCMSGVHWMTVCRRCTWMIVHLRSTWMNVYLRSDIA